MIVLYFSAFQYFYLIREKFDKPDSEVSLSEWKKEEEEKLNIKRCLYNIFDINKI